MIPYNVVGRDLEISESMWNAVHDHVADLETYYDRITRCEVAVALPHRHHQKGKCFHIHIRLHVPREDIIVSREPEQDGSHEDFYKALRDAFKVARRQLKDHVARMRQDATIPEIKAETEPAED